jgi:hypothetical protein
MPRIKTGSPCAIAEEDPVLPGVRVIAADAGIRMMVQSIKKSMPNPYLATVDCPVIMIKFCYPMIINEH